MKNLIPIPKAWQWMFLFFVLVTAIVQAQNDSTQSRHKRYHVKITLIDSQQVKGFLKFVGESRIQLLEKKMVGSALPGANEVPDTLLYSSIQTIKIRNIVATLGGTVGGTVIGAIIGGVLGWLAPNDICEDSLDPDCDNNWDLRKLTGILGAGAGGVIGAIGGGQFGPPSFEIAGQHQNFQKFREWMKKKGVKLE